MYVWLTQSLAASSWFGRPHAIFIITIIPSLYRKQAKQEAQSHMDKIEALEAQISEMKSNSEAAVSK